jgi:hypothetical protein
MAASRSGSGVLPLAGVEVGVRRTLGPAADPEQRPEGVERVEAPVEAERELVEVRLEVLRRDAVMDAVQPRLEVRVDEVDQRQVLLGDLRILPLCDLETVVILLGRSMFSRVQWMSVAAFRFGMTARRSRPA